MSSLRYFQLLFTVFLLVSTLNSVSSITNTTSCPIDMSYVTKIPWDNSGCKNTTNNEKQQQTCCQTLLSLIGIGLSTHLKKTGFFHLQTLSAATSCVAEFQSNLNSLSLPSTLSSTCFGDPDRFVTKPQVCAGIENTTDWINTLGTSTLLDSSCHSDLSVPTSCDSCVAAGFKVQSKLMSVDRNTSHAMDCFYFTVLYAAGIVNQYGPENFDTAACIFGLSIKNNSANRKKNHHTSLAFAMAGASIAVLGMICGSLVFIWWRRYQLQQKNDQSGEDLDSEQERSSKMRRPNTGSIWFKIKDLERATDNFSQKNLIGRGGFGIVYKGTLSDGSLVAVKKMIESDFQGNAEFCNEVEIISNLKHRNLVPLRGCCVTGDGEDGEEMNGREEQMRYLVYDFMPNGNLDYHLFLTNNSNNKKKPLSWPERKSIILDVAKGLAYLHYGVKPSIYHRDIKATNILLDAEMKARVADFGLAKQSREGQSHLTTRVAGTHGYLAPEYALYGQLTEKSDIYSFGIVILEIMSGRRALDLNSLGSPTSILITDWAWTLVKSGETDQVFDESLLMLNDDNNNNPKGIMERFVMVGILCAHVMVALRPTILDALKMLEGDIEVPPLPDRPLPLSHRSFCSTGNNTFSSLSTTSTTGLQFNPGDMLR
ncbi:hypothetical protein MKW94_003537 [Papaver nudicaule]|uniref:non-specific serine/threonine protein kinase n=1 Tax=Papaver nudicaule TaxID=74823 RepID=A0AA41RYL9_PAPNU|nr:hypothetical protein [Papaver nudicaule]